jgi:hypothetical protein
MELDTIHWIYIHSVPATLFLAPSLLESTTMASPRWKELYKYAACDVSVTTLLSNSMLNTLQLADGLLKLNVPGAGFLANIRATYVITCKTVLMCSRANRSHCKHTQARAEEGSCTCIDVSYGAQSHQVISQPYHLTYKCAIVELA